MRVSVNVQLDPGDRFGMSTDEAAEAVLVSLGGDKTKDNCVLIVSAPTGGVGPDVAPPTQPAPADQVLP